MEASSTPESPAGGIPEGMSKNQWKKLLKLQRIEQGRAEWKYVQLLQLLYCNYGHSGRLLFYIIIILFPYIYSDIVVYIRAIIIHDVSWYSRYIVVVCWCSFCCCIQKKAEREGKREKEKEKS